jgi:hypothetical protein
MAIKDLKNRFFPTRNKINNDKEYLYNPAITLTPPYRARRMLEDARRKRATELYDTYNGFGSSYLAGYVKQSIHNQNIQREMLKIVRCLPLLQFFTDSISRVYSTQPNRKFYIEGKEIMKKPKSEVTDLILDESKFIYNNELYEILNDLYNDNIVNGIKQAEKYTNLLNTTIYKIITDGTGNKKMICIPNDTVQVHPKNDELDKAEQIAFIQDTMNDLDNGNVIIPIHEVWTKDQKQVTNDKAQRERIGIDNEDKANEAANEYEKLFGYKESNFAFAPFVVFKDETNSNDFWNQKNDDIQAYIKSINMSLTELKYLEKFTSFGLKYTVNIKAPKDGVMDPNGIIQFAVENSSVPGVDNGKNFEIGEFTNSGSIGQVIDSIVFNLKMLFSMYDIPLDGLVSTNSVRSAENKQLDKDELFSKINAQRDIWTRNENDLFKVLCAVHNRDNSNKVPVGVEMVVDYSENKSNDKVAEDWLVEIQNNVSTVIDWLSSTNPDLDRDELFALFNSNKEINSKNKDETDNLEAFNNIGEEDIEENNNENISEEDIEENNNENIEKNDSN